MITEKLIELWTSLVTGVLAGVPGLPTSVSSALAQFPGQVQAIVNTVKKLDPIVPLDQINTALAVFLSALGLAVLITLASKALSLFTGGGGK